MALVDQEGPLALVEVDDPAFWEDLEPLPLAKMRPIEGTLTIHRWQRSGLLDSYPGTVRQVRSGRHGLSQTTLLTLEVATGAEGLGESEVVVADGQRRGPRDRTLGRHLRRDRLAGAVASSSKAPRQGDWRGFARAGLRGRTSRTRRCARRSASRPGESGVRLTRVAPNGSAGGVLRPGDVLLELGGAKLDADRAATSTRCTAGCSSRSSSRTAAGPGDTLAAKVLRDGQRLDLHAAAAADAAGPGEGAARTSSAAARAT